MDSIPYASSVKNAIKSSRIDPKSMRTEAEMGTCAPYLQVAYYAIIFQPFRNGNGTPYFSKVLYDQS